MQLYLDKPPCSEAGIVLLLVNCLLLLGSWVAAHLYIQSTLGLEMSKNLSTVINSQKKAEEELFAIQATIAAALKTNPNTYLEQHRQAYAKQRLGGIQEEPSVVREFYRVCASSDEYCITYSIRVDALNPIHNKVERLSWFRQGTSRLRE